MVDYRGPEFLRSVCDKREIKIFDRVVKITTKDLTVEDAGIDFEALRDFRRLDEIVMTCRDGSHEAAMVSLEKLIPKKRLIDIQFIDDSPNKSYVGGIVTATLATR